MRHIFLAVLFTVVAACGGGGGSDSATPPFVPPPPPPPSSGGTLLIGSDTVDAIALGIVMVEGSLQLAQTVVDGVLDYMKQDGGPVLDCPNAGGSKSAIHTDSDGNLFLSAGDILTITYSNCYESAVDDVVDGTIAISISELESSEIRLSLSGNVTSTSGFNIKDELNFANIVFVNMDADFSLIVDSSEILELRAAGSQSLTLTIDGFDEKISSFVLRKTGLPPEPGSSENRWSTEIDVQAFYDSSVLEGSFTCASTQFMFAPSSAIQPSSIDLVCTGLNGSAVRIVNRRTVELDGGGNGNFTEIGQLDWTQVTEGFLGRAAEIDLVALFGSIPIGTIQISANDAVFDAIGSRLLMTTNGTDSRFPNSLVAIDNASGFTSQLVSFGQEPNLIRVSGDGSVLYVTFVDSGIVHRYAANDNRLLDSTEVMSSPPASDQERITDLAISPIDPNLYVVAFRFSNFVRHDLALVQGTSQLSNTYRNIEPNLNPDDYEYVSFSSDGGTVIANARTILSFDQTGFLTTYKSGNSAPTDFNLINDRIHAGSVAIDETTLVRIGEYPVNGAKWAFDDTSELAFIYAFSNLHAVLREQYSLVASYRLNLNLPFGDLVSKMVLGGGRVYLLRRDVINVVRVSDVEPQFTQECLPTTLMTADNEPYTNYQCSLRAAAYDSVRDKIYLGLSDLAGENGNSIAVVDGQSGAVETYVRVNARPSQMSIAADSSKLYISFDSADRIVEINSDTLTIDRETPIPLVPPIPPQIAAEPRVAIDLHASPIDSEMVVIEVGIGYNTLNLEEYVAARSGNWLPDILQRNNRQSTRGRVLTFDDSGALYNIGLDLNGYNVEEMSVGLTGLATVQNAVIIKPLVQFSESAIKNGEATVINGDVIDLNAMTFSSRYDLSSAPGLAGTGAAAAFVLLDEPNGQAYFAYGVSAGLPVPSIRIARFNIASGQFEAAETFEGSTDRFLRTPFFEIGNDRLGIILSGSRGINIIDKSSIN